MLPSNQFTESLVVDHLPHQAVHGFVRDVHLVGKFLLIDHDYPEAIGLLPEVFVHLVLIDRTSSTHYHTSSVSVPDIRIGMY